jgi:osmotically-inducible protein OsmY
MRPFRLKSSAGALACAMMLVGLPMPAGNQDQGIVATAKESYTFRTHLKNDDIKVACAQGLVTLSGTVANEDHRFLAQETVSDLSGVKRVANQLRLVEAEPAENSDAWLTLKVRAVLVYHKNRSGKEIGVSTEAGVVSLSGTAGSEAQRLLTGDYAKDVEGVRAVANHIVVVPLAPRRPGRKIDDPSITGQVKTALLFHKSTHTLAIRVATRDGVVTLRGEAGTGAERDLVTRLAGDIEGAKRVDNCMTIK